MGVIAVFPAQEGIKPVIRLQRIFVRNRHFDAATAHFWAPDLHQIGCHALPTTRQISKPLAD